MKVLETKRNLFLYIIFCILTFGIYHFIFVDGIAKDINLVCRMDGKQTAGGWVYFFLFSPTSGLFGIIWMCLLIRRTSAFLSAKNKISNISVIGYLLWSTLGVITIVGPFIAMYRVIKNINEVCEFYNQELACM